MKEKESQSTSGVRNEVIKLILGLAMLAGGIKIYEDAASRQKPYDQEVGEATEQLESTWAEVTQDGLVIGKEAEQLGFDYLGLRVAEGNQKLNIESEYGFPVGVIGKVIGVFLLAAGSRALREVIKKRNKLLAKKPAS